MVQKTNKDPSFLKMPTFKRMNVLRDQKHKHYAVIFKEKKKLSKIDQKIDAHFPLMCKELTDEILSRDLGLSEEELKFLTIPIRQEKSKTKIGLLQELIRRELRSKYFIVTNSHISVTLAQINKAIGEETNRKLFIKNLNKKLEGIFTLGLYISGSDTTDRRRIVTGHLLMID